MAALDRALALAERDHGAVSVGEQLDLDVPRPLQIALIEQAVVAEAGASLARCCFDRLVELNRRAHEPHAAAAAAGGGLDQQWVAELARLAVRHDRNAGFAGDSFRFELVTACVQCVRGRPDPDETGSLHR